MSPTLETLLDRGRAYLAQADVFCAEQTDPDFCREVRLRASRAHSTAMRDLDLWDAMALLACIEGAVKWAERHARDAGHLGEALMHLEDAATSLRLHDREEEEAAACEAPYERLSGAQLGLSPV